MVFKLRDIACGFSQRGLSLLEVVLAMAIISMAMVPITKNVTGSLKMSVEGDEVTTHYYLAQAKMENILAQDFDIMADANGTEILGENLPWRIQVSLYDGDGDSNLDPDLKHIYLQAGEVELETLRFRIQ